MESPAEARWRRSRRLPWSAHWRSSRTSTTGWSTDTISSKPTTAVKNRNRSVSASVAFEGGRSATLLARAGTSRLSSDPWASTWARTCSSAAWVR